MGLAALVAAFLVLANRKVAADHREEHRAIRADEARGLVSDLDVDGLADLLEARPDAAVELHAVLASLRSEGLAWRQAARGEDGFQRLADDAVLAAAAADIDNDPVRARTAGELAHFLGSYRGSAAPASTGPEPTREQRVAGGHAMSPTT